MKTYSLKQKIAFTMRAFKIIQTIDKAQITYKIVEALLDVLSPYATIYLTSLIINGIAAGVNTAADFRSLLFYALAIIITNFILSVIKRLVSRRVALSDFVRWATMQRFFNQITRNMQYEHLEDAEVHLLKNRIDEAANSAGFGLLMLTWHISSLVTDISSIFFSIALSLSLFFLRAPGNYTGLQALINSPFSFFLILIPLVLAILINYRFNKWKSHIEKQEIKGLTDSNRLGRYYSNITNNYQALAEVYIFNQKPLFREKWLARSQNPTWLHRIVKAETRFGYIRAVTSLLLSLPLYFYIALKAFMGCFPIGNFVLYTTTVTKFMTSIAHLFEVLSDLDANVPYLEELYQYIDMPNTMYEGTLPVEKRAFCDNGDIAYEIEFRDVSFRYPGAGSDALHHVNMKFHIGQRLAIVGMNGSGKTTFIKLLCRLYDPTEGQILLNGVDIRKYNYDEYLSIFSVVFQDFNLFSLPLGENVAASKKYDAAKVTDCLERAGFGDRLQTMPAGLDTCLYKNFDKNGVEISGGEAQKIAMARALYKDAPFIVLDEPTAALDPMAEQEIYAHFNSILDNKTAIFISHRLSSCRFADEIAVFEDGQIVQHGNHDNLLAEEEGTYYRLWHAQAQYYT